MVSYTTNLKDWGASGAEYPDNYSYVEGEQPVDDWDNFLTSNLIDDIQHLIDVTNNTLATKTYVDDEIERLDGDGDGTVDRADLADNAIATDTVEAFTVHTDIDNDADENIYDRSEHKLSENVIPDVTLRHSVDYWQNTEPTGTFQEGETWIEPVGIENYWDTDGTFGGASAVDSHSVYVGIASGSTIGRINDNGDDGYTEDWSDSSYHSSEVRQIAIGQDGLQLHMITVAESSAKVVSTILADNTGTSQGTKNWEYTGHTGSGWAAAADGNIAVTADTDGLLVAHDTVTGSQQWTATPHGSDYSDGLAVTENYVVSINSNTGDLVALNKSDGSQADTASPSLNSGIDVATHPEPSGDYTFCVGGDGNIARIDWAGGSSTTDWESQIPNIASENWGQLHANQISSYLWAGLYDSGDVARIDQSSGAVEFKTEIGTGLYNIAATTNSVITAGADGAGYSKTPTAQQWIHSGSAWYRV